MFCPSCGILELTILVRIYSTPCPHSYASPSVKVKIQDFDLMIKIGQGYEDTSCSTGIGCNTCDDVTLAMLTMQALARTHQDSHTRLHAHAQKIYAWHIINQNPVTECWQHGLRHRRPCTEWSELLCFSEVFDTNTLSHTNKTSVSTRKSTHAHTR